MKKSIFIPLIIMIVVAFAAIIAFFKPDNATEIDVAQTASQTNSDMSTNTSPIAVTELDTGNNPEDTIDQLEIDSADSQTVVANDIPTNLPSDLPLKEDGSVDFNAAVYGNEVQNLTDSEGKSTLSNTESNYTIKAIDPETDPANELANSNTVKPLKPQSEESKANMSEDLLNITDGNTDENTNGNSSENPEITQ